MYRVARELAGPLRLTTLDGGGGLALATLTLGPDTRVKSSKVKCCLLSTRCGLRSKQRDSDPRFIISIHPKGGRNRAGAV